MARANLTVSLEITESFHGAQESSSMLRALMVSIMDESLVLGGSMEKSGAEADDFLALKDHLKENAASLVLFCRDSTEGVAKKSWVLVSWIHDNCNVRDKMLYSSSREDLKRTLGVGLVRFLTFLY